MRLIVIRHGETEENAANIALGHMPGRLNGRGISQVRRLACRLCGEKIDVIFSSDLQRARDTTQEITRAHKVPVFYTKELRERNDGIYTGRPSKELGAACKASNKPLMEFRPKGGESMVDLRKRIIKFMKKIENKYRDNTVLISTHGLVAQAIHSIYLERPSFDDLYIKYHSLNTGILILDIGRAGTKKVKDKMFVPKKHKIT